VVTRLQNIATFDELFGELDKLRASYAPARLVCTLDDLNQCMYTSAHASEDERLAYDGDGDIEEEIAHAAAALDKYRVAWNDLPGQRIGGEPDVAALVEVNRTPDRWLDAAILVHDVLVPRDDLVIAAIPNGYFNSDWNTFQNHAIIRRLETHGYRHFGVGASLLAFDREDDLSDAAAVVADLAHLYGAPDSASWGELAKVLTGQRLLLLGYTENLPDLAG
jgi:hypothetical protein